MRSILNNSRNFDYVQFNLTLIRHAETNANANGIIQGSTDTELSDIGYLQAKALGRFLQFHYFSHIYSSDLKRASETARQIRCLNRVSSCEIKFDPLLRERTYGIAQGHTRQWLRELAKENGVPYSNFTPPGAETSNQVHERAITFFRKLCQELLIKYGSTNKPLKQNSLHDLSDDQPLTNFNEKQSSSMTDLNVEFHDQMTLKKSSRSSIDSAVDLSSLSSDQYSSSSSSSIFSRNNSFEKHRRYLLPSPYENDFSDLDILIISHGAVIREFIKYFTCDLQTDMAEYLNTIHELPPNTSITRFQVTYSTETSITTLQLIDFHNKSHLITNEYNLDVTNKCSF